MPLYVYACQACELELEEMHELGQAPEKSIRCPLCGGYFERIVSLFQARSGAHEETTPNETKPLIHGLDCVCCPPRRRKR